MVVGKVKCSKPIKPKFGEIPKFRIMYWQMPSAHVEIRRWVNEIRRTIGSCGTGLGPIFTLGSAAVPPEFIVHAVLLSFIHVMYYARENHRQSTAWERGRGSYEKGYVPHRLPRTQACTQNRTRRSNHYRARSSCCL